MQTISPSSERGFTLIEMLMAVLVMTVGLLGLLQSVMVAYEHNTRSALREESFRIAEDQLNLVRIVPSFNATTTVRRDIRGGTRLFEVTRGGGVPVGKSTRVSVTVVWSYRGVSYQHEVVSVKRAR